MDKVDRKLEKLEEVSRMRERHLEMADTAAAKQRELVVDIVTNHPEVSYMELVRITGRARMTIFNWRQEARQAT